MTSSMASPFENALDRFQFSVMQRWFLQHQQEIGLSIQKLDYVQNTSDPTRIDQGCTVGPVHTAIKLINKHCAEIQAKQLERCNKLDTVLKSKAPNPGFAPTKITCRCHAGVSNVLIPYRHPKEEDTKKVWYVFIGQFLLREETDTARALFMRELLRERRFHPLPDNNITPEESAFVKSEILISEQTYSTEFGGSDSTGHISYISAIDLIAFEESALASFETFLNHYYETVGGKSQINEYFSTTKPGQRLRQRAEEFQEYLTPLHELPSFKKKMSRYLASVLQFASSPRVEEAQVEKLIAWFDQGQHQNKIQSRDWFESRPKLDLPSGETGDIGWGKRFHRFIRGIFVSGGE